MCLRIAEILYLLPELTRRRFTEDGMKSASYTRSGTATAELQEGRKSRIKRRNSKDLPPLYPPPNNFGRKSSAPSVLSSSIVPDQDEFRDEEPLCRRTASHETPTKRPHHLPPGNTFSVVLTMSVGAGCYKSSRNAKHEAVVYSCRAYSFDMHGLCK